MESSNEKFPCEYDSEKSLVADQILGTNGFKIHEHVDIFHRRY